MARKPNPSAAILDKAKNTTIWYPFPILYSDRYSNLWEGEANRPEFLERGKRELGFLRMGTETPGFGNNLGAIVCSKRGKFYRWLDGKCEKKRR